MKYNIGDVIEADYASHKQLYYIKDICADEYILRTIDGLLHRDIYCRLISTTGATYKRIHMSLTKDMIMAVESEIENYNNQELIIYNRSYTELNNKYPNSFFKYRMERSMKELLTRGLEPSNADKSRGDS